VGGPEQIVEVTQELGVSEDTNGQENSESDTGLRYEANHHWKILSLPAVARKNHR